MQFLLHSAGLSENKKNTEWFLKASLGKPDCLHTPLCWCKSRGKRQGGRLVFCDILHFLLLPALLVESQRADVCMQQVEAKVWDVLYLLDACFKSLHHQFHRQIIQLLSETAWIVSVCVHTSVIKERIKKYSGSRATDAVENHFSLSLLVKTSKKKIVLMHINLQWKSTGQVYLYTWPIDIYYTGDSGLIWIEVWMQTSRFSVVLHSKFSHIQLDKSCNCGFLALLDAEH